MTKIEWARNVDGSAGRAWNPTSGCDRCSPGCDFCYALTMAGRLKAMHSPKYQKDGDPRTSGPGFGLTLHPDVLRAPLKVRKPTTWFVNSMSDLFHPDVPETFVGSVWATMAIAEQHTFQVLTKRPQRMSAIINGWAADTSRSAYGGPIWRDHDLRWNESKTWPLPNAWLGTSIENDRYTFRANHLRSTPAAIRFLSLEPLLSPLPSLVLTDIDWVIVGAESGRGARPMDEGWVRDIRDQAKGAGAAFFYKQRAVNGRKVSLPELDGRVWDEMPHRAAA